MGICTTGVYACNKGSPHTWLGLLHRAWIKMCTYNFGLNCPHSLLLARQCYGQSYMQQCADAAFSRASEALRAFLMVSVFASVGMAKQGCRCNVRQRQPAVSAPVNQDRALFDQPVSASAFSAASKGGTFYSNQRPDRAFSVQDMQHSTASSPQPQDTISPLRQLAAIPGWNFQLSAVACCNGLAGARVKGLQYYAPGACCLSAVVDRQLTK